MSNEEIISKIWSSQLCCKIYYEYPKNNNNLTKCYYLLICRNSYLYLNIKEISQFFSIPNSQLPYIWFEDRKSNRILDWNLPIDVSYGLFNDPQIDQYFEINLKISMLSLSSSSLSITKSVYSIIALQHQLITNDKNNNTDNADQFYQTLHKILEKYWRNLIKESCYILNNSSNIIMSMSLENSNEFWNSTIKFNFKSYEKYFRKFFPRNPSNLPIKLYFVKENLIQFTYQPNIHRIFTTLETHDITLKHLIDEVLTLKSHDSITPDNYQCIAHGIILPLDSPIDELYSLTKYFDSFLHIVIKNY